MRWIALGVVLAACRPTASRAPENVTVDELVGGLEVVEWTPPEPAPEPEPVFELEPVEDAPTPTYLTSESARSPRDPALMVPCNEADGCHRPGGEAELRVLVRAADPRGETLQRRLDGNYLIERCLRDEMRSDRCRDRGAALIYSVTRGQTPRLMGFEGIREGTRKCIERAIRRMKLERTAPDGPAIELSIVAMVRPADDPACASRPTSVK